MSRAESLLLSATPVPGGVRNAVDIVRAEPGATAPTRPRGEAGGEAWREMAGVPFDSDMLVRVSAARRRGSSSSLAETKDVASGAGEPFAGAAAAAVMAAAVVVNGAALPPTVAPHLEGAAVHLVVLSGLNGEVGGRHLDRTMPQFAAERVHHVSNPTPMCADFGQEACMAPLDCVMQRLHRDPAVGGIILYGASQGSATAANYLGLKGAATAKVRAVVLEAAAASGNLTVASAVSLRDVPLLGALAPIVAGTWLFGGLLGYSADGTQPLESVRHWPAHMLGDNNAPPVFVLQAEVDRETPRDGARAVAARLGAARRTWSSSPGVAVGAGPPRVYFFEIPGRGHANCLWQPPLPSWYHPSPADTAELATSAAASARALADFHRLLALHRLPYDSALACRDPIDPGDAASAAAHTDVGQPSARDCSTERVVSGLDVSATAVPHADDLAAAADRRIFKVTAADLEAVDAIARRDVRVGRLARFLEVAACCVLLFVAAGGTVTDGRTVGNVLLGFVFRWFVLTNLVVRAFKKAFQELRLDTARRVTTPLPPNTHAASALGVIVVFVVAALVWFVEAQRTVAGFHALVVLALGFLMLPQSIALRRGTDDSCACHAPPLRRQSTEGGNAPPAATSATEASVSGAAPGDASSATLSAAIGTRALESDRSLKTE